MINPDNPIKLHEEDLLDRWDFAEHIARILLNQNDRECVVVGIYGKWGSGKSSLMNLVERNIEEITQKSFNEQMEKAIYEWNENIGFSTLVIPYLNMPLEYEKPTFKSILCMDIRYRKKSLINLTKNNLQQIPDSKKTPIIFRFNPWNISTMDKLISVYFQELSIAIEKEDKSENAKDLVKRLELYSTFFKPFTYYPDSIINAASKEVQSILKNASYSIKTEYRQTKHNLEDTKKEIEEHLKYLNRKVIVIIDDIDRLTQEEICQIFQLVKINANFENLTYILLFDREIIEKTLGRVSNGEGREYLEKIIQIIFVVPKIDNENLDIILNNELKRVLKPYLENDCDKQRFKVVYYGGYYKFFKSVRDIRRYINNLNNIYLIYKEINIIDFLIIEAFRLYTPEVYMLIADNKEFFTNKLNTFSNIELELLNQKTSSVFEQIGKERETIARPLLAYLFTEMHQLFGERYPKWPSDELQYQKEKRICSKIFFDTYFISRVPNSVLSESNFGVIIQKLKKIEEKVELNKGISSNGTENTRLTSPEKTSKQDDYSIEETIYNLINRNYANQFLRKLHIRNINFTKNFLKEFFTILFEICDYNTENEKIDFYLIYTVINKYFKSMTYSDVRKFFEDIIASSHGIYTIMLILILSQKDDEPDYGFPPLFKEEDLEYFKKLWSAKMETFAICGKLKEHKEAPRLLDTYNTWGNPEKAKKYFNELTITQEEFLNYLKKLSSERSSGMQTNEASKEITDLSYSLLEPFLPVSEIKRRLNSLDNLSDDDSKFVRLAKKRLELYKSNKDTNRLEQSDFTKK